MIAVRRPAPPTVLDLSNPNSVGAKELKRFVDRFEQSQELPKSGEYKAYKHSDVKEALTVLFHGKCAYCESKVSGSSQTDIEHYRPKGGVKDAEDAGIDHPGYWWLGMDWNNLLLSCMHCNQHRKQFIFDENMTREQIDEVVEQNKLVTTGKKNAFPTEDDNWVLLHTEDVDSAESPLLINPMNIDPEEHFEWVFENDISTIKPKSGSQMGQATKDVLGLNRRWLTEDRRGVATKMLFLTDMLRKTLDDMLSAPNREAAEAFLVSAHRLVDSIILFGEDSEPFSAMARFIIADVEEMISSAL